MISRDSGPTFPLPKVENWDQLPEEAERDFWAAGPELEDFETQPIAAEDPEALPRRLGPLPDDRDGTVSEALRDLYSRLADEAEREAFAEEVE